jgi:hypothetical protein
LPPANPEVYPADEGMKLNEIAALAISIEEVRSNFERYVIVDDYQIIPSCKKAVDDYRAEHGIEAPMVEVDWNAVYWQKP